MGSIDKRLENLERSYDNTSEAAGHNPERERILKELMELEAAGMGKTAAEEAAGNPRRRELLDELEATVKRRVAERQGAPPAPFRSHPFSRVEACGGKMHPSRRRSEEDEHDHAGRLDGAARKGTACHERE